MTIRPDTATFAERRRSRPCPVQTLRSPDAARLRVLSVFGTRPEAIKMAPVVKALAERDEVQPLICATGQHRDMLDDALRAFSLNPDADLDVMHRASSISQVTSAVLQGMERVIARLRPDCILVHGDTTTTLAAAMAAFHARIPVGHVEAGLRTGDPSSPWPEEINRRCAAALSTLHFAPTEQARWNLLAEGIAPAAIEVTGNTAVDALHWMHRHHLTRPGTAQAMSRAFDWLDDSKRLVLVTLHRRETQGDAMSAICAGLARLSRWPGVQIVLPVHPNPRVQQIVRGSLGAIADVHLIEPQPYDAFVWLMGRADLVITDSGGIQEEAPSIGKPVLVVRDVTERPEALASGAVRLAGTDPDRILELAAEMLNASVGASTGGDRFNPFGDGHAATRIADRLVREYVQ